VHRNHVVEKILYILLIGGALCVSLTGLEFGLPQKRQPDEATWLSLKMLADKTIVPASMHHPSFYLYFLMFVISIFALCVFVFTGINKPEIILSNKMLKTLFISYSYYVSRLSSVILFILSIILLISILKKKLGYLPALASGAILAFSQGMLTYSHFARTDMLHIFLILLALYFYTDKRGNIACLIAGLAISTRLTSLILLLIIVDFNSIQKILSCLFLVIAGFILGSPYCILQPFKFFVPLINVTRSAVSEGQGYSFFGNFLMLKKSFTVYILFFILAGIVALFLYRRKIEITIGLAIVVYFIGIGLTGRTGQKFMLTIEPFLALGAGYFIYFCLKKRLKIFLVLFTLSLIYLILYSYLSIQHFRNDTRDRALVFLTPLAVTGKVVMISNFYGYLPPFKKAVYLHSTGRETQPVLPTPPPMYIVLTSFHIIRYKYSYLNKVKGFGYRLINTIKPLEYPGVVPDMVSPVIYILEKEKVLDSRRNL